MASLVAAHVASSAIHFADNALRFHDYHDQATTWLNPTIVIAAWVVQTAFGLAALALHRSGWAAGRPMLAAFGALGFAGLLHLLAPPGDGLQPLMLGLIGLEATTGLALVLAVLWPGKPKPTQG